MQQIYLKRELPDEEVSKLEGRFLTDNSFDTLIEDDATVYKPSGDLLLVFRRKVLSPAKAAAAFPVLDMAAVPTQNRGVAVGVIEGTRKTKQKHRRADGLLSATMVSGKSVDSGIIGYFDRYIRTPFCRQTAFNLHHPEKFIQAIPFIRDVDSVFKREVPRRYHAQAERVTQTHPDFLIKGTAFTTITVNKNFQTAVHQDAGDLREGFGVLSALCAGQFDGCYFVYPAFRVAVNLRSLDVLLGDVHEWHGNTAFRNAVPGRYKRISCVFYYREKMHQCGSAEEELERAKHRRRGQPLY